MYEDEKEISELTKEELLDPGFIPSIYENYPHPDEREECLQQIIGVAKGLKIVTAVKKAIQKCDREVKTTQMADDLLLMMTVDGNGKTEATVDNYENAILNIKDFEGKIKFNEFTGKFERVMPDGSLKNWTDDDDAWVMKIIERECKIYDPRKFAQGMLSCKKVFGYHPIKDLIEEKEWDGKPRIDHFLADIMKCDDDDYSREVSRMIFYGGISRLYNPGCKFDYMPILIGEQGCVDCDTEFFNGYEWKKISTYNESDYVLQYTESGRAELVKPFRYIKQKQDTLWHFKTKYGIDQCLSDNHNVYYITSKGNLYHKTMKEVRENHEISTFKGRFISAFDYSGKGISLTDDEIRLMVAVFADGSITHKRIRFNLKKQRKVARLIKLLNDCDIDYTYRYSDTTCYHNISFEPPILCKHYPKDWYNCSKHQFNVIADEVMFWDGRYGENNGFTTTSKEDADFIQFVYNSLGYYASISTVDRRGYKKYNKGYEYCVKSVYYVVNYSKEYLKTLNCSKDNKTKIEEYKTKDGYEYCFTVPSGMLVLRRNNCVFVTGNCGKSSIISWLSMNTNSYREVLTIEGKEGAELLRNAWLCEFSELLAMVRSREVESMKAYITREIDTFRPAYGKHVIDVPRHCIFIGTTNNYEFLIDKTGNRRYLPIEVHTEKGEIFKHEEAIKKCVLECWREAKYLMDNGDIYLTIPNKYDDIIEQHRLQATEDDPQEGLIAQYLSDKPDGAKVCGLEIHTEVFKDLAKNYRSVQARNISNLMRRFPEWVKSKTSARLDNYGTQRYWTKISEKKEDEENI